MWSPADLAILVPMLGRAHRVQPLLESIQQTTEGCRVLFLTSPEDLDVTDAIDRCGGAWEQIPWAPGDWARKINHGITLTSEPLIFTGADDLQFHPGWYEAATAQLADGIGVVGTVDACNKRTARGQHSTHSLVARWYAEQGTIDGDPGLMHEGYVHEFADDEMVGTARRRGAYAHAFDAVVEHLHPMNGGAPMDAGYAAQAERMGASRALYRRRVRLWS